MIYEDRQHAGRVLALLVKARLQRHLSAGRPGDRAVVLGLPRGGVPVAAPVAAALDAPLDTFVVRKLGVPGHEELAFGAVASHGVRVLNDDVVAAFLRRGGHKEELADVEQRERAELERRERTFRGDRPPLEVNDRTVVLVDDGLATGATMRAAVRAIRTQRPAHVVVAVPVGASTTCAELAREGADVVCAQALDDFVAVGMWYRNFGQTSDDEVIDALAPAGRGRTDSAGRNDTLR